LWGSTSPLTPLLEERGIRKGGAGLVIASAMKPVSALFFFLPGVF